MQKEIRQTLENLVNLMMETGAESANYFIGDYRVVITICRDTNPDTNPGDVTIEACNTDCWHYAHGTCPFRGEDKHQCPLYRLFEL